MFRSHKGGNTGKWVGNREIKEKSFIPILIYLITHVIIYKKKFLDFCHVERGEKFL